MEVCPFENHGKLSKGKNLKQGYRIENEKKNYEKFMGEWNIYVYIYIYMKVEHEKGEG